MPSGICGISRLAPLASRAFLGLGASPALHQLAPPTAAASRLGFEKGTARRGAHGLKAPSADDLAERNQEEEIAPAHFRISGTKHPLRPQEWDNPMPAHVWTLNELQGVKVTHLDPKDRIDRIAHLGVRALRWGFDIFSGYKFGPINEAKLLRRIIFLETVAGVPGMVAGSLRHLRSLRNMQRDHGWIHSLLEEAENERMHLLCFMQVREKAPGPFFRAAVLCAQGVFWNAFFVSYLVSPRLCHRYVGYIEEEAVKTYTGAIEAYDNGLLPSWTGQPATPLAKRYWKLGDAATMRDMLLAVRADEANHRDVNHTFAEMQADDYNPYLPTVQRELQAQAAQARSPAAKQA